MNPTNVENLLLELLTERMDAKPVTVAEAANACGVTNYQLIKIAVNVGVCTHRDWPYSNGQTVTAKRAAEHILTLD